MRNGAVNQPRPFRTHINESIVSVRLNDSYLKSIDLNQLIETVENEIKVTPPYFWRELVFSYNRVHFVTSNKVAENLKRGELSNEYITEQGKQDKRVKETSKRLPRLMCGCANPERHEKVCGCRKWN